MQASARNDEAFNTMVANHRALVFHAALAAVAAIAPLVMECFESRFVANPSLAGDVWVRFTIEGEPGAGAIVNESAIDEERTTLTDTDVRDCIRDTMFALELGPPPNGGALEVNKGFSFRPVPTPASPPPTADEVARGQWR